MPGVLAYVLALLYICCGAPSQAQPGKEMNRIQFRSQQWMEYRSSEQVSVYYPVGYEQAARAIHFQLGRLKKNFYDSFGLSFPEPVQVFLYPSRQQLQESNIGREERAIQGFSILSTVNNRLAIGFDGSTYTLVSDLKKGLIGLALKNRFEHRELRTYLTGAEDDSWFTEGSAAILASGWTIEDEEQAAAIFARADSLQWADLFVQNKTLASRSFIYFLTQAYRRDAVKQMFFYMTQGKSVRRAARLVFRKNLDVLQKEYADYWYRRFREDASPGYPDGRAGEVTELWDDRVLLKVYHPGKYRMELYTGRKDSEGRIKEKQRLAKSTVTDERQLENGTYPYPLFTQDRANKCIYTISPQKGRLYIKKFNRNGALIYINSLKGVDGVRQMQIAGPDELWLAAYKNGRSDLISFQPSRSRIKPLTDDIFDQTGLAMPAGLGDIRPLWYTSGYPLTITGKDTLIRQPGIYRALVEEKPGNNIKALIREEKLLLADSAYIRRQLTGSYNDKVIIQHTGNGRIETDTFMQSGDEALAISAASHKSPSPWLNDYFTSKRYEDSIRRLKEQAKANYTNEFGALFGTTKKQGDNKTDSFLDFYEAGNQFYILKLYKGYFKAGVNNDYFINKYQPYQAYRGVFKFPQLGAMVNGGMSDVFENHHFSMGFRLPVAMGGSDFMVSYSNLKRRLDWHILYFRKVEQVTTTADADWTDAQGRPYPALSKVKTHYVKIGFHYPLNYHWSLSLDLAARRDKTVFLATDRYSLDFESLRELWSINSVRIEGSRVSDYFPFIRKGWYLQSSVEGIVSGSRQSPALLYGWQNELELYVRTYKDIMLELKLKTGWSGGDSRILYNFGGVDGNITPLVDSSRTFSQKAPYAFQTLVAPFRGFAQNSIYGSGYALANLDIYFPVFRSLIPVHTGFPSVKNLQLGLFGDIVTRHRKESILPDTQPYLYAAGFSARTLLAGYPIRVDVAFSPGNRPLWYLSLDLLK